jgi:fatty acid desaturase
MKTQSLAWNFHQKLLQYAALVLGFATMTVVLPWPYKLIAQLLLGAMFAHGVELEHELIHQKHFSGFWRRLVGTALGLPMLVEFTRYRITHSHHHRALGTPEDEESFAYDFDQLATPMGFLTHLSMVGHYQAVLKRIGMTLRGDLAPLQADMGKAGCNLPTQRLIEIQQGYLMFAGAIALAVGISIGFQTTLILQLWAIPLLFASPIHALVELPEHWGCQSDTTDITVNTRTILPSRFMDWFTNGNCWHVEHHSKPAMAMKQLPHLHHTLAPSIKYLSYGYSEFYQEFLSALFSQRQRA